jgi:hypothetical protein
MSFMDSLTQSFKFCIFPNKYNWNIARRGRANKLSKRGSVLESIAFPTETISVSWLRDPREPIWKKKRVASVRKVINLKLDAILTTSTVLRRDSPEALKSDSYYEVSS